MTRHGVDVLDSALVPTGELIPVDADRGGEVSWSYRPDGDATGATDVRRTARLTLTGDVDDGLLLSRLFRIWTELRATDGEWVRWYLGVFTCTLPPVSDDGTVVTRSITLAPREHLWRTRQLGDYQTVAKGADVRAVVMADLSTVFGITSTAFSSMPTLKSALTFEPDTTYATKFRRLFNAGGYDQPVTREDGIPTAQKLSTLTRKAPEATYGPRQRRVVVAGSVETLDPELPNVLRFHARNGPSLPILGNGIVEKRNTSTGPASINARGYEVMRQIDADATDHAELQDFADGEAKRLFAGGGVRWAGRIGLYPDHSERDVITVDRPRLGTTGVMDVTSWSFPLRRIQGDQDVTMDVTAELRIA